MSENQMHDPLDERDLEEALRAYSTTPQPGEPFVARLERRLLDQEAARGAASGQAQGRFGAALGAWWRQVTRPLRPALSALSAVATVILVVAAAGLVISWIAGIQQLASGDEAPASGPDVEPIVGAGDGEEDPALGPSLPTPTPYDGPSPTPFMQITPTPPRAEDFPHHQKAILVAPADDMRVPQAEFTRLGIEVVPAIGDLRARMQAEAVEIVYLHPTVFREMRPEALDDLYETGILIVVLQVPASEINAKLPVFGDYDDLPPDTFADEKLFVAAAFHNQDVYFPSGSARWAFREFYPVDRFWRIVHEAEMQWRQIDMALAGTQTPLPTLPPTRTPFEGFSGEGPSPTPTPFDGTPLPPPTRTPFPGATPTPLPTTTPFPGASPTPPPPPSEDDLDVIGTPTPLPTMTAPPSEGDAGATPTLPVVGG